MISVNQLTFYFIAAYVVDIFRNINSFTFRSALFDGKRNDVKVMNLAFVQVYAKLKLGHLYHRPFVAAKHYAAQVHFREL